MDRIFVEKKPEFNSEARHLLHDLKTRPHKKAYQRHGVHIKKLQLTDHNKMYT